MALLQYTQIISLAQIEMITCNPDPCQSVPNITGRQRTGDRGMAVHTCLQEYHKSTTRGCRVGLSCLSSCAIRSFEDPVRLSICSLCWGLPCSTIPVLNYLPGVKKCMLAFWIQFLPCIRRGRAHKYAGRPWILRFGGCLAIVHINVGS